jgi:hypothetical protein
MSSGYDSGQADHLPGGRYDTRESQGGWEVFDRYNGSTASLNDRMLRQIDRADAETVAGFLNEFDAEKYRLSCH